jgi:Spy/CpxP family protein refolding chaperone
MRQQEMLTNRRKAQLIIIATFLFGAIIGASGHYLLSKQPLINQSAPKLNTLDEITRTVGLSTDQRAQVERIMKDSRRQNEELLAPIKPQITSNRAKCREHIRAVLQPDQQALYDKWIQEQDARREQKSK